MHGALKMALALVAVTWASTLLWSGARGNSAAGEGRERDGAAGTLVHEPEEWPRVFEQHLNAGDLDAVVTLYAPDARFVPRSGDTIVGRDGIRPVLAELIRTTTRLHSRVVKVVTVDDVAVLYTDFEGTTVDAAGKPVEVRSRAMEVLRREPDGTWKLIVGDPNARA